MVVTITQPASSGPFGPGFIVSLDSTFIGPLPTGSFWRIVITEPSPGEAPIYSENFPTSANAAVWAHRSIQPLALNPIEPASDQLHHGNSVRLLAELRSPTALLDSVSQPITWDMTSGVPYIMQQLANRSGTSAETSAQLEEIDRVVHMDLGGLGRIGLGELLGLPTAGLTSRLLITPDRTLEGTLSRPLVGLDVAALGLEWEVVSAPPGVGVVQGAPDRWARRILDIQQVGTDGFANEYTRAFDSFHVDHYRLMFNPVGLTRLHYWIEPGITLRFYWLLLGI